MATFCFTEDSDMGQVLLCMSGVCAGLIDRKVSKRTVIKDLEYVIEQAQTITNIVNH